MTPTRRSGNRWLLPTSAGLLALPCVLALAAGPAQARREPDHRVKHVLVTTFVQTDSTGATIARGATATLPGNTPLPSNAPIVANIRVATAQRGHGVVVHESPVGATNLKARTARR